jgi:hypothetical protein
MQQRLASSATAPHAQAGAAEPVTQMNHRSRECAAGGDIRGRSRMSLRSCGLRAFLPPPKRGEVSGASAVRLIG